MHTERVKRGMLESVEDFCYERLHLISLELFSLSLSIVSHLVVFEVCKHRRKSLAKSVFLSEKLTYLYASCFLPKVESDLLSV
ncbi:hypothetical protein Taro_003057 [Colocasia esculenta]|uniref:Uncharacterized protein n=1 Tax=Colocasia esculenta TaxID=4460 RepID=A0A843TI78_COLES|nr:hypothetical protein [Colocasia esculenta]